MDPAHQREWEAEPVKCHACARRDEALRAWREQGGDTAGIFMAVKRTA